MEPFIGQIMMTGFNFPPRGWAQCNGQLLQISQYSALFSLLGTTYGGDGRTTFGLPDLRGRAPVYYGNGPGLTPLTWGQAGGSNTNTLNQNQLPSHTHAATVSDTLAVATSGETANQDDPEGHVFGAGPEIYSAVAPDGNMGTQSIAGDVSVTIGNTGSNQSVNNMQPFRTVQFIIALVGLFPSRN